MTEPVVEGLVSVVIPVYNRAQMLSDAVASVLAQSWPSVEIIIADDGSTDDTPALGRELERDHPGVIRYLWNPNAGAGAAREAGRRLVRGEFVQYLDSDDRLWPDKFAVQIAALRARPECGAAYGWIRLCRDDAVPASVAHKWSGRELPTLFPWLLVDRWWNTDAPLWRREVVEAIGPWSDLRYSQDWEYDARAGALGVRLAYCPEFVCDQRHHAADRQTGGGQWLAPADRVRFFGLLLQHARRAGVNSQHAEMRHFARWVFFNARQCAEMGESGPSAALIDLARDACDGPSPAMWVFMCLAYIVGWERAAKWLRAVRQAIPSRAGRDTKKQSWMQ